MRFPLRIAAEDNVQIVPGGAAVHRANQQLQLAHQKGLRAPHERGGRLLRERAAPAHDVRGAEAVQLQRGRRRLPAGHEADRERRRSARHRGKVGGLARRPLGLRFVMNYLYLLLYFFHC